MSTPGAGLPVDVLPGSPGDETLVVDTYQPLKLPDATAAEKVGDPFCPEEGLMPAQCPCEGNVDCENGYCVQAAKGKVCTDTCIQECPEGWSCELVSGYGTDILYLCVPANVNLCRPCTSNEDCADLYFEQGERCVQYGDNGSFCGVACQPGSCPEGTHCQEGVDVDGGAVQQCVSDTGSCDCSPLAIQQGAKTKCLMGDLESSCPGTRKCGPDGLSDCNATFGEEICDGVDNDCDGLVDEDTCVAPNANAAACVDGQCKVLVCDLGYVDVDTDFENGCECQKTDEECDGIDNDCDGQTDEGFLCSSAVGCEGLCVEGQCVCSDGCDLCGQQCTTQASYATDTKNCGFCGHACNLDNTAVHKCDAGVCCPLICKDGYKDCNGECADGCELKVVTEMCDGQDNDCDGVVDDMPLADCMAPSVCINGFCECDTSNPSLKKCDGQCTNVKEDNDNCGACGNKCSDLNVSNVLTFTCMAGKCVIGQCEPPFHDANQDIFDGCECQKTSMLEQCDMIDNDCDGFIDGQTQVCESECGTGTQACVAGVWDACDAAEPLPVEICNGLDDNCNQVIDEGFICKAGELLGKPCGNQCGLQAYVCSSSCEWADLGECVPQGECKPGTTDTVACGQCGTKTRTCSSDCGWGEYGACSGEKSCAPGATENQACGSCGTQTRTCTGQCEWPAWGPCGNQGACAPGQIGEQSCGTCGIQKRTCTDQCGWGDFGVCAEGGACVPGQSETQSCGNCGTRTRTCNNQCQWSSFGACSGQGVCSPGQSSSQGCGNCGTQTRTCNGQCQWNGYGACNAQGVCSPGQTDQMGCGSCGSKKRTCSGSCQWGGFSSCKSAYPCSNGFQCQSGQCVCPAPHWQVKNGTCLVSCGGLLAQKGFPDNGGGCCENGCKGATAGGPNTTWDCNYCCAGPPGCN